MTGSVSRMDRLAAGILPVNPIVGREERWPIDERLAHYKCPGAAICMIEDGAVGEARGFGRIEWGGALVEADTLFSGASISKPLTAVLAMQLVEQGAVDLDGPVNRYLDRWQLPENGFTRDTPVTLRHLLSHRGGTTVHGFGSYPPGRPAPTLIDILTGREPSLTPAVEVDKVPGGAVRYSGGGTQIVQLLIEDVTGLPYARVARERIFEPLEMDRSTFEMPLSEEWQALAAVGHDQEGQMLASRYNFTPQLGAGGLYTTGANYARFLVEFRNAWLGKANMLMSQKTARLMTEPQGNGQFGLGWEVSGKGAQARFGHSGSNDGYQCNSVCFLEGGHGAVIMTNAVNGILLHPELLTTVADSFGWDGFVPSRRVQPVPPERQADYVGRYDVVAGISPTWLDVWSTDGQLHMYIEGIRLPEREIYLDQNGRFFSQLGRSEIAFDHDATGLAQSLVIYSDGDIELIRAVRQRNESAD